jgi:uncharacterized protein YdhG (YjbR/CyaY superfamily)
MGQLTRLVLVLGIRLGKVAQGTRNPTMLCQAIVVKDPTAGNRSVPNEVDEYLARVPEPARTTLNKIRATIRSAVPPGATEAIGYRMPTFRYKGALIGYAAFPNHCGLYPMSLAVMEAFQKELMDYSTSKGTIRFPVDKPLPAALVKKIVKARIVENERKKRRD